MKYGYARVSTDGQSVDAHVNQLRDAGAEETEAEREAEAREACSQHLADLQAHAKPPRDVKIPVRFVTCRPMAITLP